MMVAETPVIQESRFDAEDRRARAALRDLHSPRPGVYWADLALSAAFGWGAFAAAVVLPFEPTAVVCGLIAVLALYRCLCFIHEISHITRGGLGMFEPVWNVVAGAPLLMPSFVYTGVHQAHHGLSTYGTKQDPEYLPFGDSAPMTVVFALQSFFIPVALLVRFLLLAPVGFAVRPFERWLASRASALTMNVAYAREATPGLLKRMRIWSAVILLMWGTALALLPVKVFIVWLAVVSAISFINTLRTLAAHRYEDHGEPRDRAAQLRDSVDVPGRWWTELWAPAGLRYHALHHYFPGIPYHNLPEAHRRLTALLPSDSVYRGVASSSLFSALRSLLLG